MHSHLFPKVFFREFSLLEFTAPLSHPCGRVVCEYSKNESGKLAWFLPRRFFFFFFFIIAVVLSVGEHIPEKGWVLTPL